MAVVGFSPGFAYLEGLPEALRAVPRRARPRPAGGGRLRRARQRVRRRVPDGVPGRLAARRSHGRRALLAGPTPLRAAGAGGPGAAHGGGRRRSRAGGRAATGRPRPAHDPSSRWSRPGCAPSCRTAAGAAMAAAGVPAAAPADPVSFALANRLVGNAASAGTLELTGGGTRLRCRGACHVAVVGGAPEVRVDGAAVPDARVLPLQPGQVLEVGRLRRGCRTYLAVAGGILGPEVFGSSASDELCGLGAGAAPAGAPPVGGAVGAAAGRPSGRGRGQRGGGRRRRRAARRAGAAPRVVRAGRRRAARRRRVPRRGGQQPGRHPAARRERWRRSPTLRRAAASSTPRAS